MGLLDSESNFFSWSLSMDMKPNLACGLLLLSVALAVAAEPAWKEVAVPDDWKKAPAGEKGRLWYRCKVPIPAAWQGRQLELVVEADRRRPRDLFRRQAARERWANFPPEYRSGLGETQAIRDSGRRRRIRRATNLRRDSRLQHRGPQRLQCRRARAVCRRRGHSPGRQMGNGQWRRSGLGRSRPTAIKTAGFRQDRRRRGRRARAEEAAERRRPALAGRIAGPNENARRSAGRSRPLRAAHRPAAVDEVGLPAAGCGSCNTCSIPIRPA